MVPQQLNHPLHVKHMIPPSWVSRNLPDEQKQLYCLSTRTHRQWRRGLVPDGSTRAVSGGQSSSSKGSTTIKGGSLQSPLTHSCLRAEATGTGRERVLKGQSRQETRLPRPGRSPLPPGLFKSGLQAGRGEASIQRPGLRATSPACRG